MANVIVNDTNLTNIANAIREKNGETTTYKPSEMADAIAAIETGGSTGDDSLFRAMIERTITEINEPGVKQVGNYGFAGCSNLTTINLPNCTFLNNYAFKSCSSVTTVNLLNVTGMNTNLGHQFDGFGDYTANVVINLPNFNGQLPSYCFTSSYVSEVYLPGVTYINDYGFQYAYYVKKIDIGPNCLGIQIRAFENCDRLEALILRKSDSPVYLVNSNAFRNSSIESGTGYIYVPSALVDTYKTSSGYGSWSTYAAQIRAIEDYPDICG